MPKKKETKDVDQVDLLPGKPLKDKVEMQFIRIDEIDLESKQGEPAAWMRDSVARSGIWMTVVLKRIQKNRYEVKDGIRRIKAAALAGHETVPARVLDFGGNKGTELAVTLMANMHRSPNPVEELLAIEGLLVEAGSPETVATQLKIPLSVIKRRLKLLKLSKSAREHFNAGDITLATAEALSTLPASKQNQLVKNAERDQEKAAEEGKDYVFRLTAKDARTAKQAKQKKLAASLPAAMFKDTPTRQKKDGARKFQGVDLVVAVFAETGERREVVAEALESLLSEAYAAGELDAAQSTQRTHDNGTEYAQTVVKSTVERAREEGRLS
jgi:ParB/RepB/Spo0J family partition protein